nr:MAG TPA: hypothetical protein [Caudoviricetes sp.]
MLPLHIYLIDNNIFLFLHHILTIFICTMIRAI